MNKEDIRELLRSFGFTRVDGLRILSKEWVNPTLKQMGIVPTVIPKGIGGRVRMGNNNGFTAVETPDGEIWLGKPDKNKIDQLIGGLCHMDIARMENVPCSKGESLDFNDLMSKNANPDFIPKYE